MTQESWTLTHRPKTISSVCAPIVIYKKDRYPKKPEVQENAMVPPTFRRSNCLELILSQVMKRLTRKTSTLWLEHIGMIRLLL